MAAPAHVHRDGSSPSPYHPAIARGEGRGVVFVILATLVALTAGLLQGGRIARIRWSGLEHLWLIAAAAILQGALAVLYAAGALDPDLLPPALTVTQFLLVVWLAFQLERPGALLLMVGVASNALVMALNGGMPVHLDLLATMGGSGTVPGPFYVALDGSTRLAPLADVLPLPPLRSIVSPGDVLVAIGLVPFLGDLMASPAPGHRPVRRRVIC